jgi:ubiquinone/menaquinone biosynthesis C-methylase UbiE
MSSITAFAGNVPLNYETYLGPLFFEPYALDLTERIKDKNGLQNVLEIACGTGRVTKHLINNLSPDASLVATDLNNDMLAIAKQRVQDERISWQVADAHQLPFDDQSFDLVICQFGVMFFSDKVKALKEVKRVLKAEGRFLFNTWDEIEYNALSRQARLALLEVYPDEPPKFLEKGPYSFYKQPEIKQVLHDAGFENTTIEVVAKTGTANHVDDGVNGILDGTPNAGYIAERNIPAAVVKEKLRAMLIVHYGETDLQLPMQAFVIEAKK